MRASLRDCVLGLCNQRSLCVFKAQIEEMIELLIEYNPTEIDKPLQDAELKHDIGLNNVQFTELLSMVPSLVSATRNENNAIKALLKLDLRLFAGWDLNISVVNVCNKILHHQLVYSL